MIKWLTNWGFLSAIGFLSGGIMFCRILPAVLFKTDISKASDDGNPGAANVFKSCGIPAGLFCLLLDMLKGFLPVFYVCLTHNIKDISFALVMLAPVLGHAVAPYSKKTGGKCIAVSFGVLLALIPHTYAVLILAGIYIITSTVFKIDPTRKRSIFTFSLFAVISAILLCLRGLAAVAVGCVLLSAVVVLKHSFLFQHNYRKNENAGKQKI